MTKPGPNFAFCCPYPPSRGWLDRRRCSGSSTWPSPAELVALGTRAVIVGSEPSSLVFSIDTEAIEVCVCVCVCAGVRVDSVRAVLLFCGQ